MWEEGPAERQGSWNSGRRGQSKKEKKKKPAAGPSVACTNVSRLFPSPQSYQSHEPVSAHLSCHVLLCAAGRPYLPFANKHAASQFLPKKGGL